MAKYPASPKAYPGTPKAYPVLPKAYPGSSIQSFPSGVDTTAPTLVSAVIPSAGTSLTLTYSEILDATSTPAAGAYALGGTVITVSSVNITSNTVVLTLSGAVDGSDVITVSYTAGGAPVQDLAGNDAANLVNQAVTNGAGDILTDGGVNLQFSGVDLSNG